MWEYFELNFFLKALGGKIMGKLFVVYNVIKAVGSLALTVFFGLPVKIMFIIYAPMIVPLLYIAGPIPATQPKLKPQISVLVGRVSWEDGTPLSDADLTGKACSIWNDHPFTFDIPLDAKGHFKKYLPDGCYSPVELTVSRAGKPLWIYESQPCYFREAKDLVTSEDLLPFDKRFYLPECQDENQVYVADVVIPQHWASVRLKILKQGTPFAGGYVVYRQRIGLGGYRVRYDSLFDMIFDDATDRYRDLSMREKVRTDESGVVHLSRLIPGSYDFLCYGNDPATGEPLVGLLLNVPVQLNETKEILFSCHPLYPQLPVLLHFPFSVDDCRQLIHDKEVLEVVETPSKSLNVTWNSEMDQLLSVSNSARRLKAGSFWYELINQELNATGFQKCQVLCRTPRFNQSTDGVGLGSNEFYRGWSRNYHCLYTEEVLLHLYEPSKLTINLHNAPVQAETMEITIYPKDKGVNFNKSGMLDRKDSDSLPEPEMYSSISSETTVVPMKSCGDKQIYVSDPQYNPLPILPDWKKSDSHYENITWIPPVSATIKWDTPIEIGMKRKMLGYIRGNVQLPSTAEGESLNLHCSGVMRDYQSTCLFDSKSGDFFGGPYEEGTVQIILSVSVASYKRAWYRTEVLISGGKLLHCKDLALNKDAERSWFQNSSKGEIRKIDGIVLNPERTPVFGAQVMRFKYGHEIPYEWTLTDVDGRFQMDSHGTVWRHQMLTMWYKSKWSGEMTGKPDVSSGLPKDFFLIALPGMYGCTIQAVGPDRLGPVTLTLPPAVSCKGSVRVADWPDFRRTSRVTISARYRSPNERINDFCSIITEADASGDYHLGGMTPGTYEVQAALDGIWLSHKYVLHVVDQDLPPLLILFPEPGDRLFVHCVDREGNSIADVPIIPEINPGPSREESNDWNRRTDFRGIACLEGMAAGSREILIGSARIPHEVFVPSIRSTESIKPLTIVCP